MKPLLLILALLIAGCCSPEMIIRDRVDTLYIPIGGDTNTVYLTKYDTVWQGETVKYLVRVDTLFKKVFIERKPDTIKVPYEWKDTVQVVGVKPDEGSWLERQIWKLIIMALCLAGAIYLVKKAFQ